MAATERTPGRRTDVDGAFRGSATYRSPGEQELGPAEERFEKARRTVGLFLGAGGHDRLRVPAVRPARDQHLLAAVLLGVIVLWITEPVPIPVRGLIGIGAIVTLGVVPADDALTPFGTVLLLLLNRPEIRRIEGVSEYVQAERAELGKLPRAEKNTLVAFTLTVACWIFPGVIAPGVHAAERDRVRLRGRADHQDDPPRHLLRHPRSGDRRPAAGDGRPRGSV